MRVGVVTNQVPYITGGAERHADNLVAALRAFGHLPELIRIPFKWYPGETLARHVMAARLLDLGESDGTPMDLMIGLKFPAWLAQHPDKAYWIVHQHRQAYDLWDSGESELCSAPDGLALRDMIRVEDKAALGAVGARVYCNSGNVAGRLSHYLGIDAPPLYHPPGLAEKLRVGDYGDYLFMPSRIGPLKRQTLAVEALARTRSQVRLVIAGPADSDAHRQELESTIRREGVGSRVDLLGPVSDGEMARHYAECRAVVFIPVDEDYGYISLEAMLSARPVITATDSGGPLEFIGDDAEGIVTDPDPERLAQAFDRLYEERADAIRMGEAGRARYDALDIGWEKVIRVLTGETALSGAAVAPLPRPKPKPKPVVTPPPALAALAPSRPPPVETETAPLPPAEEQLRQAVHRPTGRGTASFADIDAIYACYDFDRHAPHAEAGPYFGTHWNRYCETLDLIRESGLPPGRPLEVLDIGLFPPFIFQAMLLDAYPQARIEGVWEGPQPNIGRARSNTDAHPSFSIRLQPANVETDRLPFEDDRFDLILGMEIIEHLAINPAFFLQEAWRVLKRDGRLVLTTPNVIGHRQIRKALSSEAPYSHGPFVPTSGFYGRHNRELTPLEVLGLAEGAGFDTLSLATADLYGDEVDPDVAQLLVSRGDDLSMRGEVILYAGKKAPERPPFVPEGLYHGDPYQLGGILRSSERDPVTGVVHVSITNISRKPWYVEGEGAVTLFARWRNSRGEVGGDKDYPPVRVALPQPLAPGESADLVLHLDPGDALERVGMLELGLYQQGAGLFSRAHRGNDLLLTCSEKAWYNLAAAQG